MFCGSRKIARELRNQGMEVGRLHVTTLMRRMGISMDGNGRWTDNVLIERLWCPVKYEEVCQHACRDGTEARRRLATYFDFVNSRRLFADRSEPLAIAA